MTPEPEKGYSIKKATSTTGWVYVVALPDGYIKIGFAQDLEWRWSLLADEYGSPVVPLATFAGGAVNETLLHHQFADLRMPGNGERFKPDPSLLSFAVKTGLNHVEDAWLDGFAEDTAYR